MTKREDLISSIISEHYAVCDGYDEENEAMDRDYLSDLCIEELRRELEYALLGTQCDE